MSDGGHEKMDPELFIMSNCIPLNKIPNHIIVTLEALPASQKSCNQQVLHEAKGNSIISFQKGNIILANCDGFTEIPSAVPCTQTRRKKLPLSIQKLHLFA